ncbi:hypothetical protein T09_3600 [Trichinella sp. T9]|nr:hypothetical protein T09_3600 [Trichinella sp. T9]KRZ64360.1 hypothetical protein T08_927 [Trichinella sp. T8]
METSALFFILTNRFVKYYSDIAVEPLPHYLYCPL